MFYYKLLFNHQTACTGSLKYCLKIIGFKKKKVLTDLSSHFNKQISSDGFSSPSRSPSLQLGDFTKWSLLNEPENCYTVLLFLSIDTFVI